MAPAPEISTVLRQALVARHTRRARFQIAKSEAASGPQGSGYRGGVRMSRNPGRPQPPRSLRPMPPPHRSTPPSVALAMSARAPASARAICLLVALATIVYVNGGDISCNRDGLYADYDTECRVYMKCSGGALKGRYTCPPGRAFSEAAGACVSRRRQLCVRRVCALGDNIAYATPGTACRHYYRCENGTAIDHSCPSGAWFDLILQSCTRGAGTCYEPVCAGLPDGTYPDSSHQCRRTLQCSGAELRGVTSCTGGPCVDTCPPARSTSIPLPAGDADFCSDEVCSSLCQNVENGAYADRSTACREYFVCESKRVIRRGVCEAGLIFSNGGCVPVSETFCRPPARSPCFNRPDGLHRDWRDCSSWFNCHRERVIARGSCDVGLVFDSNACVPKEAFSCEGPEPNVSCEGLPSGTYQDFESNCTRYFHCEGPLKIKLMCPSGQVFDGRKCVDGTQYLCPSLEKDSCYGRPDGRYRALDTGCRGYYACYKGEKAVYACEAGKVFDGESCVPAKPGLCPVEDHSCSSLTNGYHPEVETGCHRYFYCEGGDRLVTLSCLGGKIFDGRTCVEPRHIQCAATRPIRPEDNNCEKGGFFTVPSTGCKSYYFCVNGMQTTLTCPDEQIFNGQICVPKSLFQCPG